MIGLDTNVLIRYLLQDDEKQSYLAVKTIEAAIHRGDCLYVCLIVLCEVVWVLDYHYELKKEDIVRFLDMLLHSGSIEIENREEVLGAFQEYQKASANFADCLIGKTHQSRGCTTTYSFDKKALKLTTFTQLGNDHR